jgi:hypothetical protein
MRRDQGRLPPPGYVRAYDAHDGFWAYTEVVGGHHLDGSCEGHHDLPDHDDQGSHYDLPDHDDQAGFDGFGLDDRRAYYVFIVTFADYFFG